MVTIEELKAKKLNVMTIMEDRIMQMTMEDRIMQMTRCDRQTANLVANEILDVDRDAENLLKEDSGMRYTDALKKIFEVMEGREDIKEIKFFREQDTFEVISDDSTHVCFGSEFRNK